MLKRKVFTMVYRQFSVKCYETIPVPAFTKVKIQQEPQTGVKRQRISHKSSDRQLFSDLENDPEGKHVQRDDWQRSKLERFKTGRT